ncbi:hypothetical protein HDU96_002317, partial [Phlyctochytrium bullatum]
MATTSSSSATATSPPPLLKDDDSPTASPPPSSSSSSSATTRPPQGIETFFGFIATPLDALHVVQGCRTGKLRALVERPRTHSRDAVRSGSIIV